jgi:hypothetical protein
MKFFITFLLVATAVAAQQNIPVLGKTEAVVRTVETATFYHSTPGDSTCVLKPGSVGSLAGCTYTPPSGVVARQFIAGCQVLPNDSIYNVNIKGLPTHADSAAMMLGTFNGPLQLNPEGSMTYNIIDATTPTYNFLFNYTPAHNGNYPFPTFPFKQQAGAIVNGPGMGPNQDDDDTHNYMIYKPEGGAKDCYGVELYKRYARTDYTTGAQAGKDAQSGVEYSLESYATKNGTTNAAGLLALGTKLRLTDFVHGYPRHTLAVQLNNPYIDSGGWVWPGTSDAGNAAATAPYYAARLRLKASFVCNATGMNASGTRAEQIAYNVCEHTLKENGMTLSDGSTNNWDFWVESELLRDPDVVTALATLRAAITPRTDFEVVDVASVEPGSQPEFKSSESQNTYTSAVDVAAYNTLTGAYPADYAEVEVTRTSDSLVTPVRLVLRAPTVGTDQLAFTMVGGQSTTIKTWVGGTSNQGVTFSTTGGTLGTPTTTATGTDVTFTAPTPASKTNYIITATSAVDANAKTLIYVAVIPALADNIIRIDIGAASATSDGTNTWHPDANMYDGYEALLSPATVGTATNWNNVNGDGLGTQHRTVRYVSTGDLIYEWRLTPGFYEVELWVGKTESGVTHHKWLEAWVDVNGKFCSFNLNLNNSASLTRFTGTYPHEHGGVGVDQYTVRKVTCPALVGADGKLMIATRHHHIHGVGFDSVYDSLRYTAMRISPGGAAKITISAEESYNALYKNALRRLEGVTLHPVYWNVGEGVTWSLSGPGTLVPVTRFTPDIGLTTNSVRYVASTVPSVGQVTITATSTVNPALTAQAVLDLEFGTITVTPAAATVYRGNNQAFTAILGGGPYTNVTWTRTPAAGNINAADGRYFVPPTLDADATVTIRATSNDNNAVFAEAVATVPIATPTLYLDTISAASITPVTDGLGNTWTDGDDVYLSFTGATVNNTTANTIVNAVNGEEPIYKTVRAGYGLDCPNGLTYTYPVAPGVYSVRLMWNGHTQGNNTMNVTINGAVVLNNFNPGSFPDWSVHDEVIPVSVTNEGQIQINLKAPSVSNVYWIYIAGIQITYLHPIPQVDIKGSFAGATVQ